VPEWATWEEFRRLEGLGLTMYGQMTAGSWIYIGSQGIVQGTYETFAEAGRQHYGGDWSGKWILTAGLGGMGGAQPLAATMAGASMIAIECDPSRIEMRLRSGYLDAQAELQAAVRATLTADPHYAEHAGDAAIERNRRLLFAWDGISLALCMSRFPWTLREVPVAADDTVEVTVTGEGLRVQLDPWPFDVARLRVHCDGRRLDDRFDDEASMRAALDRAPWRTLVFELEPAPPG